MSERPYQSAIANPSKAARIQRLRSFSRLLDNAIAIPGTRFRIGLDPILGLIPGGGDFIGIAFSAYIVLEAAQLGLPKETVARMVSNIILESLAGTVPVVGDLVDFAWKANTKNMEMLESHFSVPRETKQPNKGFIFLLLAGLLVFGIGLVAVSVLVIRLLWSAVSG